MAEVGKLKVAIRVVVLLVVVFFLWRAIQMSLVQLDQEQQRLEERIAEFDAMLATVEEPAVRASLEAEKAKLAEGRLSITRIHWPFIAAGLVLYLVGLLPAALFFYLALRQLGQRVPVGIAIGAHLAGHLGKYIPGKAAVVVIRASAVRTAGAELGPATVAVFVETLTMMAVGATGAGVIILLTDAPLWLRLIALGIALAAFLPTLPPCMRMIVKRLSRLRGTSRLFRSEHHTEWLTLLWGWALMGLTWLLFGLAYAFIIAALPGAEVDWSPRQLGLITATIALAIVIGFASLLPGGAGVRELVLTTLLGPLFGLPTALLSAIVFRLLSIAAEAFAGGMLFLIPTFRQAMLQTRRMERTTE